VLGVGVGGVGARGAHAQLMCGRCVALWLVHAQYDCSAVTLASDYYHEYQLCT
jgi:hypothetical protein